MLPLRFSFVIIIFSVSSEISSVNKVVLELNIEDEKIFLFEFSEINVEDNFSTVETNKDGKEDDNIEGILDCFVSRVEKGEDEVIGLIESIVDSKNVEDGILRIVEIISDELLFKFSLLFVILFIIPSLGSIVSLEENLTVLFPLFLFWKIA